MEAQKKESSPKKGKVKPLTLKCLKLTPRKAKEGGHYCGRLYHSDNDQLQRVRGGPIQFFDKEGNLLKKKWELFPKSKNFATHRFSSLRPSSRPKIQFLKSLQPRPELLKKILDQLQSLLQK